MNSGRKSVSVKRPFLTLNECRIEDETKHPVHSLVISNQFIAFRAEADIQLCDYEFARQGHTCDQPPIRSLNKVPPPPKYRHGNQMNLRPKQYPFVKKKFLAGDESMRYVVVEICAKQNIVCHLCPFVNTVRVSRPNCQGSWQGKSRPLNFYRKKNIIQYVLYNCIDFWGTFAYKMTKIKVNENAKNLRKIFFFVTWEV